MAHTQAIGLNLETFLKEHTSVELAAPIVAIANASKPLARRIRRGPLEKSYAAAAGSANSDGDAQKALDLIADDLFCDALKGCGVRAIVSEERERPLIVDERGPWLVAIDPLDGSSNIDVNISIGTIFSVLEAPAVAKIEAADFLQVGRRHRAAGFVVYGPQTHFVFTAGEGVHIATLDTEADRYVMTGVGVRVPENSSEFAINASNYRHWAPPVRAYFDDCIEGAEGPRGKNFNMRWVASMVADLNRILMRGGVYLYPGDSRRGYSKGRLHLLYEAFPAAMLMEQAGGGAIDGQRPILDITPDDIHARTPLVFGSRNKVARIQRYLAEQESSAARSPLFGKRGLLRR